MSVRSVMGWLALALLGIALAAGVTIATKGLVRQPIGLGSEPLTAGDHLAPERHAPRAQAPSKRRHEPARHPRTPARPAAPAPPATVTPRAPVAAPPRTAIAPAPVATPSPKNPASTEHRSGTGERGDQHDAGSADDGGDSRSDDD